jgi:AraC-like DNA-binding protein
MVSNRCKLTVKAILKEFHVIFGEVNLGEVDIIGTLSDVVHEDLRTALKKAGLELMDDKHAMLIQKIKDIIVEMVHHTDEMPKVNFSDYLCSKIRHDYTYMANQFSEAVGITIEHYIILHKIERVKEFIMYDELNLTEIARKMHYSSVAHLSNQFKKVTGLTPSYFKLMKQKKRIPLEEL